MLRTDDDLGAKPLPTLFLKSWKGSDASSLSQSNETIEFRGLGIRVEVLRVNGNTDRLGIKAPNAVRILRGELAEIVSEF